MSRTFMMVVLVLSIITISYADESFNRLCMGGSQQPPKIQDCTVSNYQRLISDKVSETKSLLDRKANEIEELTDKIDKKLRLSLWPDDFDHAQDAWESYFNEMVEFQEKFINTTHKGDHFERKCMIDKFKFDLLGSHLSYLDGKMRFFCQFYSQTVMQQRTEGMQGNPNRKAVAPEELVAPKKFEKINKN